MDGIDNWIAFAKGPLFAFSFIVMLLGLFRHAFLQTSDLFFRKNGQAGNVPWKKVFTDFLTWLIPVKYLIPGTVLFTVTSFFFHIGVLLVPVFLGEHVVLWNAWLGLSLPGIAHSWADGLTLLTLSGLSLLYILRLIIPRLKAMTQTGDYLILLLVGAPFLTGFVAAHPSINPFSWNTVILAHYICADALLLAIPFTKLSHISLFVFNRISQVHWQFRPGAGEKIANSLFGEEVKI